MAQTHLLSSSTHAERPTTPPKRLPIKVPRLSPSRMPDQLVTSASYKNGHLNLDTFSPVNQNGSFEFDRVLKSGRVLRRVKKKGAWKPSWKSAYLVLRPNLLSVYKNMDETELRASITLSDLTAVARVKKSNTENVFGVFTPAKNYHFAGMNDRETSDWVTLLRIESRLGDVDNVDLPPPGLNQTSNNVGSDTTDLSAEDDAEPPASPEGPGWAIRGNKSRHGSNTQRKPSGLRDYSGNEAFTTSQSDLSDAFAPPTATTGNNLSSSLSKSKNYLSPIPDGPFSPSRPSFQRSTSQLSVTQIPPSTAQTQNAQSDPNRVVRQSHLHLLKPVPGTSLSNWKAVWAVLRANSLSVYKSSSEYEPLKIISVSELIDVAEIDPVKKTSKGKGEFCFQVIGLEKTIKFSVESETELEEWIGSLKSVLAKRNRPRGHSAAGLSSKSMGIVPTLQPVGGPAANLVQGTSPLPPSSTVTQASIGTHYAQTSGHTGQARLSQQHLQRPESALDGIAEGLEETNLNESK